MKNELWLVCFKTKIGSEKTIQCYARSEKGAIYQVKGRHDFKTFLWAVKKYV